MSSPSSGLDQPTGTERQTRPPLKVPAPPLAAAPISATPLAAAPLPPTPTASIPILATKLLIPPPARHLIERGRLYDTLDEGVAGGIVLLSAPAGAGKTVLLSAWIAARELPGPACWLSLDGEDNDVNRLLENLVSALRDSGAPQPGGALDDLVAPAGAGADRFLALLVNGLAELRSPVVLVLDEIHELTSPSAAAAIDFLVRHAPAQLRLVLAGRADPPLPIDRLRAGGALTELRIAELAFNRAETAELCGRLELALSDAEIDSLWARTEGWPAAVRLAALSLRGHPEPARFLAEFAGTDRAVADYLIAEVLARLPRDNREFMLHTCLVDAVSPELADALTGGKGGTLPLAELERLGAPVQPTAANGRWYRYHPLFRELLRAHLHHAHPRQVPSLHRRAACWYAEQGQAMPAIHHALEGEDWGQAGQLIAEHWLELFLHGGSAAMRGPMAQLPGEVVASDPRLAAAVAGSRLQDGDLQDAERHLAIAREAGEPASRQAEQGQREAGRAETDQGEAGQRSPSGIRHTDTDATDAVIAAVSLRAARLRVHPADAERFATELSAAAHGCTRHCWTALRSFALCDLGATLLWSGGERETAIAHLHEALALATEHQHEQIALDCLAQLAVVDVLRGALTQAEERSTRAVELADRIWVTRASGASPHFGQRGWCEGPAAACAQLTAATCAYQRGELERAEGLLARAAVAADTAETPVRLAIGILQALTLAAAGQRSAARGALKLSAIRSELADGAPAPDFVHAVLDDAEPRVLMAAGEVEQARATLAGALEEGAQQRRPAGASGEFRAARRRARAGPRIARASARGAAAKAAPASDDPARSVAAAGARGSGGRRAPGRL